MSSKKCLTRVSSKSVLPERCAPVSSKGVLQECHLSVSGQGVPQVGSLENVTSLFLFLNTRVGIRVRGLHLVFFSPRTFCMFGPHGPKPPPSAGIRMNLQGGYIQWIILICYKFPESKFYISKFYISKFCQYIINFEFMWYVSISRIRHVFF